MKTFQRITGTPKNEVTRLILGLMVFALAAGVLFPFPILAGEKGKTDGCLTSLYNYPAEVQRAYPKKPLISLHSQPSKNNNETKRIQKSTPSSPQN